MFWGNFAKNWGNFIKTFWQHWRYEIWLKTSTSKFEWADKIRIWIDPLGWFWSNLDFYVVSQEIEFGLIAAINGHWTKLGRISKEIWQGTVQCCHIWGNFGSKRGNFFSLLGNSPFGEILGWPIFFDLLCTQPKKRPSLHWTAAMVSQPFGKQINGRYGFKGLK